MKGTSPVATCLVLAGFACPALAGETATAAVVAQATAALCDKRIAVLGELPSHGEGRAFQIKADIVRALVTKCDFDAVLFEAPIYDFIGLEQRWAKGNATQAQLDDAIGRFWSARELAAWRGWLFDEARAGRLSLGGLDDQVSATSRHARAVLPGLVASRTRESEAGACRAAVERHLSWTYDEHQRFDDAEQRRLLACAQDAVASTGALASAEDAALVTNLAYYVARQVAEKEAVERDASMFRNVAWYRKRLPAEAKLVLWTATVHGAKQRGELAFKPLGTRLAERWGSAVGSIGFTALGGSSSMAGRPATPLVPAPADSLEARALRPGVAEAFVSGETLAGFGSVESRLLGKFTRADWSTRFDGIVVIRNEVPPTFGTAPE